ncbi:molecular chaperone DnaK, partial [Pseudomonas aeruginosa]|nr:molecular chaperone DnaK [Pseudomonas aeruginosa]
GELEAAVKGDDKAEIEAKMNALSQASTPLAQKMYAEQAQQGEDAPQGEQAKAADDVVDAEFEEVKDNK